MKYCWKRLISFGRENGKILKIDKYIEAKVFYDPLLREEKRYTAYINNQLLGRFSFEREAMLKVEEELDRFFKEVKNV